MRILIVTPCLPWPLNSGGNAAQFSTLKSLAKDHEFVMVCMLQRHTQLADLEDLGKVLPQVRFVGVPEWEDVGSSSGSFIRAIRKIYRFIRSLLVSPPDAGGSPGYPFIPLTPQLIEAVDAELKKGVDICQIEFVQLMQLAAWVPRNVPKVFVHHQIHYVYARRFIAAKGDTSGYLNYMEAIIRAQEVFFLKQFDSIVTFSVNDLETLKLLLPDSEIIASPFPLPSDIRIMEPQANFNGDFCLVASEAHWANKDALDWLLKEVWPKIAQALPAARLKIIGDWTEKTKKSLAGPRIHFTGFVKELSSVLPGSIMLVPLRIGSGIRTKILAAFALGAPVVTTTIGGEGILAVDGKEMLVRDAAVDFADAAINLARQPELWRSLAAAGQKKVRENYSPEIVRGQRNQIYERLATLRNA